MDRNQLPPPNYLNKNEKSPLGSRNGVVMDTMQPAVKIQVNGDANKNITSPNTIEIKRMQS